MNYLLIPIQKLKPNPETIKTIFMHTIFFLCTFQMVDLYFGLTPPIGDHNKNRRNLYNWTQSPRCVTKT